MTTAADQFDDTLSPTDLQFGYLANSLAQLLKTARRAPASHGLLLLPLARPPTYPQKGSRSFPFLHFRHGVNRVGDRSHTNSKALQKSPSSLF
jgi:hypothetical protein